MMYPQSIEKLINIFSKFPTVGPRTAARFVFFLLKLPKEDTLNLTNAIIELKEKVRFCLFCFQPMESDSELCDLCRNQARDKELLCIVEKESDLITIEKTRKYKGFYFILGGTLSSIKKTDIQKLRIAELEERIKNLSSFIKGAGEFKEIIIATNATPDGQATALYLERLIKPFNIKTSKLGRGMPAGGELEYADEETLSGALEGRK